MTKKHPPSNAFTRARTLRRDMTDAERKVWSMVRGEALAEFRFRRQVPIAPSLPTLPATAPSSSSRSMAGSMIWKRRTKSAVPGC